MAVLKGKNIVLGVTGCIAAYKAAEITRKLAKRGANVKVIMTEAATHFITPLTFKTLSQNPVITGLFDEQEAGKIYHISISEEADLLLVAPASANVLAKVAAGIADDMLTTAILACRKPIIFAPAMNSKMYLNPATQKNLSVLRSYGYGIVEPEEGDLACGEAGIGRLAVIDNILDVVEDKLQKFLDLEGLRILVTAGGTHESIDPIRFVGNKSSGLTGYALAEAAASRGAKVALVSGPTSLPVPFGVKLIEITTAEEMRSAVVGEYDNVDVVIKAAAVADFKPAVFLEQKIKKDKKITLELSGTNDILEELGRTKKDQVLVGFAAESEDLVANAKRKLKKKKLDLIIANDISRQDIGIGKETNQIFIIDKSGRVEELPVMYKREIAQKILDKVTVLAKKKKK